MYFLMKGYYRSKVSNLHKSLEYHDNVVSSGQLPWTKNSLVRELAREGEEKKSRSKDWDSRGYSSYGKVTVA